MKINIKPYPLMHPSTIVLVGTIVNGKPNFTTIGDVAVAGLNPPLLMISLNENHNATKFVLEKGKMSVNYPGPDLMREVDFAGIYSSKTADKSDLVESELVDGLPVVSKASITLLIKVIDKIQVKHRIVFVCDVYETLIDESLMKDGKLDLSGVQPILYGPDNLYYSNISPIGTGYNEGKYLLHNDQEIKDDL